MPSDRFARRVLERTVLGWCEWSSTLSPKREHCYRLSYCVCREACPAARTFSLQSEWLLLNSPEFLSITLAERSASESEFERSEVAPAAPSPSGFSFRKFRDTERTPDCLELSSVTCVERSAWQSDFEVGEVRQDDFWEVMLWRVTRKMTRETLSRTTASAAPLAKCSVVLETSKPASCFFLRALETVDFITNALQLQQAIVLVRKRVQDCIPVDHDHVHHAVLEFLQLGEIAPCPRDKLFCVEQVGLVLSSQFIHM